MITNSSKLKFKYHGSINLPFICNFHFKIITWCGAVPGFSFIVCGRGGGGGGGGGVDGDGGRVEDWRGERCWTKKAASRSFFLLAQNSSGWVTLAGACNVVRLISQTAALFHLCRCIPTIMQ